MGSEEEMAQILLTNKKQEIIIEYILLTLLSQYSFAFTIRNMFISLGNLRSPVQI
jgi:hypothetical protein